MLVCVVLAYYDVVQYVHKGKGEFKKKKKKKRKKSQMWGDQNALRDNFWEGYQRTEAKTALKEMYINFWTKFVAILDGLGTIWSFGGTKS